MEGTCYGPPHVGCNEKIGINSLSDELLGSKNEPFKGGGACRPHFGPEYLFNVPKSLNVSLTLGCISISKKTHLLSPRTPFVRVFYTIRDPDLSKNFPGCGSF